MKVGDSVPILLKTSKVLIYPQADFAANVLCIGFVNYTVNGQTVTAKHDTACRVGYLVDGAYVAIKPTANGDGKANSSNYGRMNAVIFGKTALAW